MKATKKTLAIVVGSAFAASIAATGVNAAENPFAIKSLSSGYTVADAEKGKDGKCGTGKCGAEKKKAMEEKAQAGSTDKGDTSASKPEETTDGADQAKEGTQK